MDGRLKTKRATAVAAMFVVLLAAARVHAAPTIEIDTTLRRAIDESTLARSLSLELADDIERVETIVVTPVDGGVHVHVTVDREARHETVLLDDTAHDARVRVLALAIAELVRRRAEPVARAAPPPSTPIASSPRPIASSVVPAESAPSRPRELSIAVGAHHGFEGERSALRAQAALAIALVPTLAFGVALDGMHDSTRDALGVAALDVVTLGGSVTARPQIDVVSLELGPRLAVGVSWGSGSAAAAGAAGRAEQALVVTGGLVARVRVPQRARVFGMAEAGADYVLRGVELRANDRVLLRFAGVVADALVGVGIRL